MHKVLLKKNLVFSFLEMSNAGVLHAFPIHVLVFLSKFLQKKLTSPSTHLLQSLLTLM